MYTATYDDPEPSPPLNSRLPFIPPPDYSKTIKPKFAKQRAPVVPSDHNLAVFTDFNKHNHIVDLNNGKMLGPGDLNGNSTIAPVAERLSPDEKREQTKSRVLKMLQAQGVPVFPGLTPLNGKRPKPRPPISNGSGNVDSSQPHLDPNANIGVTKAYIKHLENHRKFDTLHSFQSCENCPICKQMINEIDMVVKQRQRTNGRPTPPNHQSLITSGKAFQPPTTLLEEEEPDEFVDEMTNSFPNGYTNLRNDNYPSTSKGSSLESRRHNNGQHYRESSVGSEPTEDIMTARAKDDWNAEGSNQLSIKYGETLRVLKMGQDFICCQNAKNEKGWVPTSFLYLMPIFTSDNY